MTDKGNCTQNRGMNRDTIKYIAMVTMLLNHISFIFLEPGTLLAELFTAVGYFTAPVMCYFLVEGMGYTRSSKKYGQRLLLFAVIFGASLLPGTDRGKDHRICGNEHAVYTVFVLSDYQGDERDDKSSGQKSCPCRTDSAVYVL